MPSLIGNKLYCTLRGATPPHEVCDANAEEFLAWLSKEELLPYISDCLLQRLSLDNGWSSPTAPTGVAIRPGNGTAAVAHLDGSPYKVPVWQRVLTRMENEGGYIRDVTVQAATYDWRLSPAEWTQGFYPQVTAQIEHMAATSATGTVALVSLSQGSPMTADYLATRPAAWKKQFIHSWTSFSGVFGGSVDAFLGAASLMPSSRGFTVFGAEPMRQMIRSWPSTYYLLPRKQWYPNATQVSISGRNYTAAEWSTALEAAKVPHGAQLAKHVAPWIEKPLGAPGVPLTCIHGSKVPTPSVFVYGADGVDHPTAELGDGDGTVLLHGLVQPCVDWGASLVNVPGLHHGAGMGNDTAIDAFFKVLGIM